MDAPQPPDVPRAGRALRSFVGVVVAAVAIGAAGYAIVTAMRPRPPAPVVVQGGEPGNDDVSRALRLAGIDSTRKSEWVEAVPGADLGALTSRGRELFVRFANAERCTCGCGFTLAACRRFDSTCEVSGPRVEALVDSIRRGLVTDATGLRERPASASR